MAQEPRRGGGEQLHAEWGVRGGHPARGGGRGCTGLRPQAAGAGCPPAWGLARAPGGGIRAEEHLASRGRAPGGEGDAPTGAKAEAVTGDCLNT